MGMPPKVTDRKQYAVEELAALWDVDDEVSIPRVLPMFVAEHIMRAHKARPELFIKNEHELISLLHKEKATPGVVDRRLRLSFWEEYNRVALSQNSDARYAKLMNMENVVRGVCTKAYFTDAYLLTPQKVAFLVCPPASYLKSTEEALIFGIDQLREILEIPNMIEIKIGKSKETKLVPNVRLMEVKAKIVLTLAHQAKGSIINHKIESKSLSIVGHVGSVGADSLPTMRSIKEITTAMSVEEIDRKLEILQKRARKQSDLLKLEGQKTAEYEEVFGSKESKGSKVEREALDALIADESGESEESEEESSDSTE